MKPNLAPGYVRWRLARFTQQRLPRLRKVPWSLWAFAVLSIVAIVVVEVRTIGDTPAAPLIFFPAFILVWDFFLLSGFRWVWLLTIAFGAVTLVLNLATASSTWLGDSQTVVTLILLLLPVTRRFFRTNKMAAH